ncbi:hypothetical protein [Geothermobacter hydrogeniphilus]|uniref:hypothetical protein n=1 Tax=Geothermobacter hydrogeniphilus TaxID=1969733 RepID=UPI00111BE5F0|nr:hypothetical protein [Geothermobacter hydrogeniphilus]
MIFGKLRQINDLCCLPTRDSLIQGYASALIGLRLDLIKNPTPWNGGADMDPINVVETYAGRLFHQLCVAGPLRLCDAAAALIEAASGFDKKSSVLKLWCRLV